MEATAARRDEVSQALYDITHPLKSLQSMGRMFVQAAEAHGELSETEIAHIQEQNPNWRPSYTLTSRPPEAKNKTTSKQASQIAAEEIVEQVGFAGNELAKATYENKTSQTEAEASIFDQLQGLAPDTLAQYKLWDTLDDKGRQKMLQLQHFNAWIKMQEPITDRDLAFANVVESKAKSEKTEEYTINVSDGGTLVMHNHEGGVVNARPSSETSTREELDRRWLSNWILGAISRRNRVDAEDTGDPKEVGSEFNLTAFEQAAQDLPEQTATQ